VTFGTRLIMSDGRTRPGTAVRALRR